MVGHCVELLLCGQAVEDFGGIGDVLGDAAAEASFTAAEGSYESVCTWEGGKVERERIFLGVEIGVGGMGVGGKVSGEVGGGVGGRVGGRIGGEVGKGGGCGLLEDHSDGNMLD